MGVADRSSYNTDTKILQVINIMTTVANSVSRKAAEKLLQEAVSKSNELDAKMNISIVDLGANLVAFIRMDGAILGSIDVSLKKAKTAVYFGMDSENIGSLSVPGGALYNIEHSNGGLITFGGGVPLVTSTGDLSGAIGVSGGSVENDKIVAMAAQQLFKTL